MTDHSPTCAYLVRHEICDCAESRPVKLEAQEVREGDWIKIGGLPHAVKRVENIGSLGTPFMRLHFNNGFLNINGRATIKVTR